MNTKQITHETNAEAFGSWYIWLLKYAENRESTYVIVHPCRVISSDGEKTKIKMREAFFKDKQPGKIRYAIKEVSAGHVVEAGHLEEALARIAPFAESLCSPELTKVNVARFGGGLFGQDDGVNRLL